MMVPTPDTKPTPTDITQLPEPKVRATVELIKALAQHPEHAQYMKELVHAEAQRDLFDQDYRLARVFAQSGKFDDIKGSTPEQAVAAAMAKIRIGRELGMSDADAMSFVMFINGRPGVSTEYLARKMKEAGYSWDVEWHWGEEYGKTGKPKRKSIGCTLWLKQLNPETKRFEPVMGRDNEQVSTSFTEDDAETAGLLGKAGPWKQWTQDMYFWRAMSRLRKYHVTSVLPGAIQVELAGDYTMAGMAPQLEAPAAPEAIETETPEEERKPLRERLMEQEEQGAAE